MAELNFVVDQTALQTVKNTVINANFDEMKESLTLFAEPYKNVIVSESEIGVAKSDRARIRSVSKHIDDYRKAVKNVYTEPLKAFEAKCKELTAICDEAALNIDKQVKEYETKRREEKLFLLQGFFECTQKEMTHPEYITWEWVFNEKWGNATYDMNTARTEISDACLGVDKDVEQIIALSSEFQLSLLDNYKKTHDVFGTFQMQERLAAQKLRDEQRQRELEEEYKAKRAEKKAEEIKNQSNPEPVPVQEDKMYVATYRIYGTQKELASLQSLFKNLRIRCMVLDTKETTEPVEAVLG